jgi:twitching motility protein PilT
MELKDFLQKMIDINASDVFIVAGLPISYRSKGRQIRMQADALTPEQTLSIVKGIYNVADRDWHIFNNNLNHDDDFSFALPSIGRFRANIFRQRGSLSAVIRIIPFGLPDPVKFHIPEEVLQCSKFQKGLVLVTGPAGAGKSTTLACIIDRLNHERTGHIITMEDPIEFAHRHNTCIVTQREIPTDVATYGEALRSALREAPDIMLLGEMRDYETISTAITAAETAQLLLSTLHTTSASGTIDRIIDVFPAQQQRQIRLQLASSLQAIISQQLIPAIDGNMLPAFEIMFITPSIRNLIREEKAFQIDSVIASKGDLGMRTMDQSLFDLVKEGKVAKNIALQYSIHYQALKKRFEAEGL